MSAATCGVNPGYRFAHAGYLLSCRIIARLRPRWVWFYLIRDDADYAEYCYINPVKHGPVRRVQDWPHSSFHRDVRLGLFALDWAGDMDRVGEFGERE
jgi:putative transposase